MQSTDRCWDIAYIQSPAVSTTSVLSCFYFKQARPLLPEKPITPQTANDTSIHKTMLQMNTCDLMHNQLQHRSGLSHCLQAIHSQRKAELLTHDLSKCCVTQVGLDDVLHTWFQQSSIHTGEACLEAGVMPRCRSALQTGAPPALRPGLWAAALALNLPQASIEARFQGLCSQVEDCNLLTDLLVSGLSFWCDLLHVC